MALHDVIKKIVREVISGMNLTEVEIAEVTGVDPLEIKLDQRYILSAEFLILTERVQKFEIDYTHAHDYLDTTDTGSTTRTTEDALTTPIVIRTGLIVGDKVLIQKVQGGQAFVVLDKVV